MLQATSTAQFRAVPRHPALRAPVLLQRLSGWLLRCWEAQCRQAEQPARNVPYY